MKANQLKSSKKLADVVLGDVHPIVTQEGRSVYEYVNGERTEKVKGYATELVLISQNFEKVRCVTPNMPRIFMAGEITESLQVELVNPIAEITWNNEIRFYADDIVLSSEEEVIDL